MILSLTFEVLQGGSTDITYYVQCFDYQSNSQNVDTLQFTTDFLVNGKTAKKNVVPKVNENGNGGIFINYENGKGTKTVVTTQLVVSMVDTTPTTKLPIATVMLYRIMQVLQLMQTVTQ